nr:MAG TPA: hypothetical protein [Caudoviricetes sp.]
MQLSCNLRAIPARLTPGQNPGKIGPLERFRPL